jgi:hypothetical protein
LLQLVGLASRLWQDPPLGNEDDMLAGELLLQLADESGLDLLEGLELRHGHEDDDGLLALDFDLLGGRDVELAEVALQVRVDLEIEQSLRDRLLELIGLLVVRFDNLCAGCERHLQTNILLGFRKNIFQLLFICEVASMYSKKMLTMTFINYNTL